MGTIKLTTPVETAHVVAVIRGFCELNAGDDSAAKILIACGADILECSADQFLELMHSREMDVIIE